MHTPATVNARRLLPTTMIVLAGLIVSIGACTPQPAPTAPPSPSPSASASAAPSPSPSGSPAEVPCATADLTARGGPWGGAAGSRGSDVVVQNTGTAPCVLPAAPAVAMIDQAGNVQLSTQPAAGAGPSVEPGGSVGFSIVVGNWCDQEVSLPLHFSLALASESIDVDGLTLETVDDLPPCNGPGQPATLEATAWQPG